MSWVATSELIASSLGRASGAPSVVEVAAMIAGSRLASLEVLRNSCGSLST